MSGVPQAIQELRVLRTSSADAIINVRIDNPPINLFDDVLARDLEAVLTWLESSREFKVCIVESANPDFFVAHYDVSLLLAEAPRPAVGPGPFNLLMERLRAIPQLTIGKIDGIARGGGSELLLALDVRYGSLERGLVGQPEVALGIIPGGGATQRLTALVGRSRALEMILGGGDLGAREAEAWGYLTRAVPTAQLNPMVNELAQRVSSFPADAIAAAKRAINAAEPRSHDGLTAEAAAFESVKTTAEARRRMRRFLELGGQTDAAERDLTALYPQLAVRD